MDRLEQLRDRFDEWQVDGVLITSATNRRYLSGFTGSAGQLLITRDAAVLSTDSRYWEQAQQQAPDFAVYRNTDADGDLLAFLQQAGAQRLGIEARHVTLKEFDRLAAVEGFEWVKLDTTAEPLRAVKSDDELARIRAAAEITDLVVGRIPELARPGITERQLAWLLEVAMREMGADGPAFDIIVASGPSCARPHHRPDDRALQPGDVLVIDLGAELDGYKSDLTRSFYLGDPPTDRFLEVYGTVLRAQQAALDGLRAGVAGQAVDALARDAISAAGFGQYFGHGLGHGVGLDIHEEPRLGRRANELLPANAVVTIEPGIYIPDWGGVRIEDLALVTADGVELLSHAEKNPVIPL